MQVETMPNPNVTKIMTIGVEAVAAFLSSMFTSRAWVGMMNRIHARGEELTHAQARQLGHYLEEFLVVISRGPLELSLEGVHDGEIIGEEVVVAGCAEADSEDQRN